MTHPATLATLALSEKDALIAALLERNRVLGEQVALLTARVAVLEAENKALQALERNRVKPLELVTSTQVSSW